MTDLVPDTAVMPAGYDPTAPDASRHTYAKAMLAEAHSLVDGVHRFVVLVAAIKDQNLFALLGPGYKTFDAFVQSEFGVSRSTGNRWVTQGHALLELVETTEPAESDNGVPTRPTGPAISQREAVRRATGDQVPVTLDPIPTPMVPDPEPLGAEPTPPAPTRPDEPPSIPSEPSVEPVEPVAPAEPNWGLTAEGWEASARVPTEVVEPDEPLAGRIPGGGRNPGPQRQAKILARRAMNEIMTAIDKLGVGGIEALAAVATPAERRTFGSLVVACGTAAEAKRAQDVIPTSATAADEAAPVGACLHPVGQRYGSGRNARCAVCGEKVLAK